MFILINDNYCVTRPVLENRCSGTVTKDLRTLKSLVNYCAVSPVPFATKNVRQPQKKGLSPLSEIKEINSVNCVSFVDHCVSAPGVTNARNVVHAPQVGGRLQPFWQTWALLGANPRVVSILKDYEMSDQEALTLHQVKAHDVRAFAASKAFQGGISLEQILAACHWKSHNTFTQFYLKDVTWADSELFHLGPVVAAQQMHQ